ncbi:MAG: DUF1553 domain-containing protein [Verrucomicrobia bacterium]|nr:DUF1553 domain-containing protein [Verrucomicrobiota bacterium]
MGKIRRDIRSAQASFRFWPERSVSFRAWLLIFSWFVAGSGSVLCGSPSVASDHWSFQPVRAVPIPSPTRHNPIDAFLDQRLRERGLRSAPPASREAWLRRVSFDLTGLPPTPSERASFLADRSQKARERVVDRLLASPRHGERWAQHWLDLAHYADSNGFELDADRPDAWRYRDWVIAALNRDLPYDEFLTLQVAGDEAAPGQVEALIASGFGRAGPREEVAGNIDPEVKRQDELTHVTSTIGSVFMGLTIGCARCHDHKFDPIPAADYYSLQAHFAGVQLQDPPIYQPEELTRFQAESNRIRVLIQPLAEARKKLEQPYRDRLRAAKETGLTPQEKAVRAKRKEDRTPEEQRLFEGTSTALNVTWEEVAEAFAQHPADHQQREALKRQIHDLEIQMPPPPARAMSMVEVTNRLPETQVLFRGNVKAKREAVEPAPPRVLVARRGGAPAPPPVERLDPTRSGRRLALARWMADPSHPLTSRVIVNRLWQHHFGRGLVATPSDFGARGARPSHPELLDWLAGELIRNQWRLKPLHRLMVLSEAYGRDSDPVDSTSHRSDPDNATWWRMNRRRMDAEGLRDSVLAVSGRFDGAAGGPGVRAPLEPEVRELIFTEAEVVDLWPVDPRERNHHRRSIYLMRKRNVPYPLLNAFDAPDAQSPCPERAVSTHAPQALALLNSQFAQKAARDFANSLLAHSDKPSLRVEEAYLRCFGRKPTTSEIKAAIRFIQADSRPEMERWTDFTLALLNTNEFIHVP